MFVSRLVLVLSPHKNEAGKDSDLDDLLQGCVGSCQLSVGSGQLSVIRGIATPSVGIISKSSQTGANRGNTDSRFGLHFLLKALKKFPRISENPQRKRFLATLNRVTDSFPGMIP
jgi:hypothetical protein